MSTIDTDTQLSGRAAATESVDRPLRADVRVLGELLGRVLREAGGDELLADVEHLRGLVIRAYDGDTAALEEAEAFVDGLETQRAEQVARAFTVYFHLVNLAEEHHRVRVLRERGASGSDAPADSIPGALALLADEVGADEANRRLRELRFHPVFTAHPTEARRRAVASGIRRVADQLSTLHLAVDGTPAYAEAERRMLEEIDILWRTSPLRTTRLRPRHRSHLPNHPSRRCSNRSTKRSKSSKHAASSRWKSCSCSPWNWRSRPRRTWSLRRSTGTSTESNNLSKRRSAGSEWSSRSRFPFIRKTFSCWIVGPRANRSPGGRDESHFAPTRGFNGVTAAPKPATAES